MSDLPVVSYEGGVAGLPATKPGRGQKIDPNDSNVSGYASYLDGHHARTAGAVGSRKVYDYRYSFNGFATELSDAQASALASVPGVLTVTKDEVLSSDTSSTPAFLGLSDPGGLWDQL